MSRSLLRIISTVLCIYALAVSSRTALAQTDAKRQIPDTDDGQPGAGPIRRSEAFKKLWLERRTKWAGQKQQDQGAVVFLGDSITQGWGMTWAVPFPA